MKKILFVMLAVLALAFLASPVIADGGQIVTIPGGTLYLPDGSTDNAYLIVDGDRYDLDFGPSWWADPQLSTGGLTSEETVKIEGKLVGTEIDVYESWDSGDTGIIIHYHWRDAGRPPWVGPHPQGK